MAGAHDLSADEASQQIITGNATQNPDYSSVTSFDHDSAVIHLDSDFSFNADVAAICRPSQDFDSGPAVTTGWGSGKQFLSVTPYCVISVAMSLDKCEGKI